MNRARAMPKPNIRPLSDDVAVALLAARAIVDRALPPWPVTDEEGWWLEVLHDPRARRSREKRLPDQGPDAYLRLDRHRSLTVDLACSACGLRRSFDTETMLKMYGPDYNVAALRHELVRCPRRGRDAVYSPCPLSITNGNVR